MDVKGSVLKNFLMSNNVWLGEMLVERKSAVYRAGDEYGMRD